MSINYVAILLVVSNKSTIACSDSNHETIIMFYVEHELLTDALVLFIHRIIIIIILTVNAVIVCLLDSKCCFPSTTSIMVLD